MTREEAIEILSQRKKCMEYVTDNDDEAFDMAIKALEHPERNVVAIVPCGDTISRQAVIDLMMQKWGENFSGDDAMQESIDAIRVMPSVTPQEPRKGHWILTDVEGNKVWHCNCSECGKDPQVYIGGSENWWLIKPKLPKFCPSCGSDNREVEE